MTRKPSFFKSAGTLAVAAGLAVGIGFATPALAGGKAGHGGPRLERAIERLELDETQRAEVLSVIDAARPAGRELRGEIRAAHKELKAMLADPTVDENTVLAQADAIGALRTELSKHQLSTLLQVREQLSPEQQEKLAEAMQKRHGRRHGERRHDLSAARARASPRRTPRSARADARLARRRRPAGAGDAPGRDSAEGIFQVEASTDVELAAAESDLELRFATFVEEHRERARRMAWRLVGGDAGAADDVAQEAFVRAWMGLGRFRGEASLGTWFYRILVRQAAHHRRWRQVREIWGGLGTPDAPDPNPDATSDPALRARIGAALERLPGGQREAFVLVHVEGFTVNESAEILGKASGTVKSHLHRALRALRTELADLASGEGAE